MPGSSPLLSSLGKANVRKHPADFNNMYVRWTRFEWIRYLEQHANFVRPCSGFMVPIGETFKYSHEALRSGTSVVAKQVM